MSLIADESVSCPVCQKNLTHSAPIHHLLPGTVLNRKFLVGCALGEGGFGITYIGWDLNLDLKVAIKEYFPNGYVNRSHTTSASVSCSLSESSRDFFNKGRERFLKEARILARLSKERGVVEVRDFFEENNTAYIIMEYLDGVDLKEYLKARGTIPFAECLQLLIPTMNSLTKVHAQGLIHRDISPDNLRLTDEGVKLLDFGAARDFSTDKKSLSVMLKPGYAPEEQYRSKGLQGPWTDVYALCATIYKCITGITPHDSPQRIFQDELKKPSELGVSIDQKSEAILMKGLAVLQKDRYQSIQELMDALGTLSVPAKDPDRTVYMGAGECAVCEPQDTDRTQYSAAVVPTPVIPTPVVPTPVAPTPVVPAPVAPAAAEPISATPAPVEPTSVAPAAVSLDPQEIYRRAVELSFSEDLVHVKEAIRLFSSLGGYQDSSARAAALCQKRDMLTAQAREIKRAHRKKVGRTIRITLVSILIPALIGALGILFYLYLLPAIRYNHGIELKDQASYSKAVEAFKKSEYENYKDQIDDCYYLWTQDLIADGDQAGALEIWEKIADEDLKNDLACEVFGLDNLQVGDTITFGTREWQVLGFSSQGNALLMCKKAWGSDYYDYSSHTSWEDSHIREALRTKYATFSEAERSCIASTSVTKGDGTSSSCKLFLLSVGELNTYFPNKADRAHLTGTWLRDLSTTGGTSIDSKGDVLTGQDLSVARPLFPVMYVYTN